MARRSELWRFGEMPEARAAYLRFYILAAYAHNGTCRVTLGIWGVYATPYKLPIPTYESNSGYKLRPLVLGFIMRMREGTSGLDSFSPLPLLLVSNEDIATRVLGRQAYSNCEEGNIIQPMAAGDLAQR